MNLTTADIVVNLDPSWNPAYDLQSQDRAYLFSLHSISICLNQCVFRFRIGQTNDVKVFRFFSLNTIEQQVSTTYFVCYFQKVYQILNRFMFDKCISSSYPTSL